MTYVLLTCLLIVFCCVGLMSEGNSEATVLATESQSEVTAESQID